MLADFLANMCVLVAQAAICITAIWLPCALLIWTVRTARMADRVIKTRVLIVANIILVLFFGHALLIQGIDTLYATAFVGYSGALLYLVILWLVAMTSKLWLRVFGSQQARESDGQTDSGVLVS